MGSTGNEHLFELNFSFSEEAECQVEPTLSSFESYKKSLETQAENSSETGSQTFAKHSETSTQRASLKGSAFTKPLVHSQYPIFLS